MGQPRRDHPEQGELFAEMVAETMPRQVTEWRSRAVAVELRPSLVGPALARLAAPAPGKWVRQYDLWPQLHAEFAKRDDLAVPLEPTAWSQRCARQPARAWQLWTGLRALGLDRVPDGGRGQVPQLQVGMPRGALVSVEAAEDAGERLVLTAGRVPGQAGADERWYRVQLGPSRGRSTAKVLTPGPTLEEQLAGEPFDVLGRGEAERCRRWLEADRPLALVLLLGPMGPRWLGGSRGRRIKQGLLDEEGKLTEAGWWRLAYLAEQGIGEVERRRWTLLTEMHDRRSAASGRLTRRRHLELTQRLVLELMEQGWVPLGVEHSATAVPIRHYCYMRPDALMLRPPGTLVWVELLRRRQERLQGYQDGHRSSHGQRYRRMREQVLPFLAGAWGGPVELYLRQPGGDEHVRWLPPDDPSHRIRTSPGSRAPGSRS